MATGDVRPQVAKKRRHWWVGLSAGLQASAKSKSQESWAFGKQGAEAGNGARVEMDAWLEQSGPACID